MDGKRVRGANCTSADAAVRFRHGELTETLLIEWKYTESYGQPISQKGNKKRLKRYQNIAFGPDGPIRNDLNLKIKDFFFEPFYQLFRQQMFAFQMEKAKDSGSSRVRVLHIAPAANLSLRKVTSPALRRFGDDAFAVFRSLLVSPENFVSRSTEDLFGPIVLDSGADKLWSYVGRRYAFLAPRS
jgi:hypothetical protein